MTDAPEQRRLRLQVAIAHSGLCSRRKAEDLILAGRVRVNGQPVQELGTKVNPGDRIEVDGQVLAAEERKHYLVLNKPAGYLCAASDQYGRPLAVDLFGREIAERIYNVGRLDFESSGLVIFTNDGIFAAGVSHPSSHIVKQYRVNTDKPVSEDFAQAFMRGIADAGDILRAEAVRQLAPNQLLINLREGKNREIRRALAAFGLHAWVLHRVAIGPVAIGELARGAFRPLSQDELAQLRASFAPGRSGGPSQLAGADLPDSNNNPTDDEEIQ